jgi:predicted nucleotidyltransferase
MKRDEAIAKLRQHETDLRQMGVESLYLFGSTARGEARSDSDVDLFFDYDPDRLGLRELFRIKN